MNITEDLSNSLYIIAIKKFSHFKNEDKEISLNRKSICVLIKGECNFNSNISGLIANKTDEIKFILEDGYICFNINTRNESFY